MAEKIPRRSKSESRKKRRSLNEQKNKKLKAERLKERKEAEKANIEHRRTDPLGLTAYQRRKYDKNHARIIKKYGKHTPGVKVGGGE